MEGRVHEWKKDVIHLFRLFVYNLWRTCFWVMITGFSSCSFLAVNAWKNAEGVEKTGIVIIAQELKPTVFDKDKKEEQ